MVGGAARSCWLLLTLFMKGVLAGDWSVDLPSGPICAAIGSSVVLPCSYDYPRSSNETNLSAQDKGEVLSEMWCLEDSRCITQRYVYHSDGIFPDPSYQNRVEYLGRPGTKNCSLRISDLRLSDSGAYVFYLITKHPTQKMPEQSGVQLLVSDSSSAVTVLASPSSEITEGGALRLACCSPAASPQARFRWFKSTNSSLRHSGQVWSISDVTPDASGSYFCQIQSGDKVHNSTTLHIDVQYSPRNTFVSVSPAGDLQEELPRTLTCSSDANPPVHTYSWYMCFPTEDKSSHQVRQTPASPTGRSPTLSSSNITVEELGLHCCEARNRHGSQTFTAILKSSSELNIVKCYGPSVPLIILIPGVLLAVSIIVAVVVLVMIRRCKSPRSNSYVLTETTATAP
uniref:cell adhesion molecule 4-like n=1 Tax=Semicossyphus pulcher TaxID=241346 RepID=UPI0037E7EF98